LGVSLTEGTTLPLLLLNLLAGPSPILCTSGMSESISSTSITFFSFSSAWTSSGSDYSSVSFSFSEIEFTAVSLEGASFSAVVLTSDSSSTRVPVFLSYFSY